MESTSCKTELAPTFYKELQLLIRAGHDQHSTLKTFLFLTYSILRKITGL